MADGSNNPADNARQAELLAKLQQASADLAAEVKQGRANIEEQRKLATRQEQVAQRLESRLAAAGERGVGAGEAGISGQRAEALAQRASLETRALNEELTTTQKRLEGVRQGNEGALGTRFIQRLREGNVTLKELGDQAGITIAKFAGWTAAAGLVYGALGALTELKKGAVDAQSGVENLIRFIPGLDKSKASQSFVDISQQLNVPITDVAQAEGNFARIFKNQTDLQTAARVSILATKLDNVSLADSYRYLTALVQEFKLKAQDLPGVFDKLAAAQANAGGKVSELYAAIAKSAGVLRGAGVTNLTDIIALENTFQVRTGQTGNVIGTGFARGAANFFPSQSSQQLLKSFGIDTSNFGTALREAIAKVSSGAIPLSDATAISKAFFGPLRGGLFTSGLSSAAQLQTSDRALAGAQGQADRELKAKLQQADEVFKSFGNTIQRLGAELATSGILQSFLTLTHVIGTVVGTIGGGVSELSKALGTLGGFFSQIPGFAIQFYLLASLFKRFNIGSSLLGALGSSGAGAAEGTAARSLFPTFGKIAGKIGGAAESGLAAEQGVLFGEAAAGAGAVETATKAATSAFANLGSRLTSLAGASVGLGGTILAGIALMGFISSDIQSETQSYEAAVKGIAAAHTPAAVNRAYRAQTGVDVNPSIPRDPRQAANYERTHGVTGDNIALRNQALGQNAADAAYNQQFNDVFNDFFPQFQKVKGLKHSTNASEIQAEINNLQRFKGALTYFLPDQYNAAIAALHADLKKLHKASANPYLTSSAAEIQKAAQTLSSQDRIGIGTSLGGNLLQGIELFQGATFQGAGKFSSKSDPSGASTLASIQATAVRGISEAIRQQMQTVTDSSYNPSVQEAGYAQIQATIERRRNSVNQGYAGIAQQVQDAEKKLAELQQKHRRETTGIAGVGDSILGGLNKFFGNGGSTPGQITAGEVTAQQQVVDQLKARMSRVGLANKALLDALNLAEKQVNDAKTQLQAQVNTLNAQLIGSTSTSQSAATAAAINADRQNTVLMLKAYGAASQQYKQAVLKFNQDVAQQAQNALSLARLQGQLGTSQIQTLGPAGDLARLQSDISSARRVLSIAQNEVNNPNKQQDILNAQIGLNNLQRQLAQTLQSNARQAQQYAIQIRDSGYELRIAQIQATNPIKAAQIALQEANYNLASLRPSQFDTPAAFQAARAQARVKVAQSAAALRQTTIDQDIAAAQFQHDIGKSSDQAYIAQLQQIIRLKGISLATKRQLLLEIYRLQHANDGNLDLNVGNIKLPTIYQVRQAILGGRAGAGGAIINHTAHVTVNVHSQADAAAVGYQLDKHLGTSITSAARAAGVL